MKKPLKILLFALAIIVSYIILFVIIHKLDLVVILEKGVETKDSSKLLLLSVCRLFFYLGMPPIIALLYKSLWKEKYLISLKNTFNIFFILLLLIKTIFFFTSANIEYGLNILNGADSAIFLVTFIFNIINKKKTEII